MNKVRRERGHDLKAVACHNCLRLAAQSRRFDAAATVSRCPKTFHRGGREQIPNMKTYRAQLTKSACLINDFVNQALCSLQYYAVIQCARLERLAHRCIEGRVLHA